MIAASPLGLPRALRLPLDFDTTVDFFGLPFFLSIGLSISVLLKAYPLVILCILKYALGDTLIISLIISLKLYRSTYKAIGYLYVFTILYIISYIKVKVKNYLLMSLNKLS